MSTDTYEKLPVSAASSAKLPPSSQKWTASEQRIAEDWFQDLLLRSQGGVVSETVTLSPVMANVLLSYNPENRNVRENTLYRYVSDLQNHRWQFNGEPIILSKEGLLNDGQHRCRAIVVSGVPMTTVITVGVSRDSRTTVDAGAARTAGDHLGMLGTTAATTSAAIARLVIAWENAEFKTLGASSRITNMETIDRALSDELIQAVAPWIDSNHKRFTGLMLPSLVGFCFYAISKTYPARAKIFMETFRDGTMLSPGDPILVLRERLRADDSLKRRDRIEAFFRAWNAWIRNETLAKILVMGNLPELKIPHQATIKADRES